jgi:uncharacterized small protein (DUF1192 family)
MNNEQQHDPTVTLRLELGRITDQRDAFKAALNTEVLKVVRVAIIQATISADNEIARLKAEVERLTKAVASSPVAQARLKELEGKTTFEEINPKDVQP